MSFKIPTGGVGDATGAVELSGDKISSPDANTYLEVVDGEILGYVDGEHRVRLSTNATEFIGPNGGSTTLNLSEDDVQIATDGHLTMVSNRLYTELRATTGVTRVRMDTNNGVRISTDSGGSFKTAATTDDIEAASTGASVVSVTTPDDVVTLEVKSKEAAIDNLQLIRTGNVVQFVWNQVIDMSVYSEGVQLFELPEGFRPMFGAEFVTTLLTDAQMGSCVFYINTDGLVVMWGNTSDNEYYRISGTFITNEDYIG